MSAVWAAVLQLLPGKTALSESDLAALYQYQDENALNSKKILGLKSYFCNIITRPPHDQRKVNLNMQIVSII